MLLSAAAVRKEEKGDRKREEKDRRKSESRSVQNRGEVQKTTITRDRGVT